MTNQQKLDEIERQIIDGRVCPELASTANRLVFGSGNSEAEVIFIGEAPGKNEDRTGKPFVGAAGKFLDEMLESVGLNRRDIYITNIVKYRPPENRDPLPEEKKKFWPYLLQQIKIIKPKIIVTLGRHSGQALIPSLHISADHGKPKRVKISDKGKDLNMLILPLYHPAAALYNGSLRATLLSDFQSMTRILKQA